MILNRLVANKLLSGQSAKVSVELVLQHGENTYTITREQTYTKDGSGNIKGANTVFDILRRDKTGNTTAIKPTLRETEIKSILPKELSKYFFFDGERIERMSKDISTHKKATDFADAVRSLLGLKGMEKAIQHLNPGSKTSVIGQYEASYDASSSIRIFSIPKSGAHHLKTAWFITNQAVSLLYQKATNAHQPRSQHRLPGSIFLDQSCRIIQEAIGGCCHGAKKNGIAWQMAETDVEVVIQTGKNLFLRCFTHTIQQAFAAECHDIADHNRMRIVNANDVGNAGSKVIGHGVHHLLGKGVSFLRRTKHLHRRYFVFFEMQIERAFRVSGQFV